MKASLVSAKELHGRNLAGSVQIFDCRFALNDPDAGRAAFEGQGIPGANYVDLEEDLSGTIGADTARHPLPSPNAWLGKVAHLGLNSDKMIVAYDDGHGMFAARLWWMLSWIGLENVCLLDGGFAEWTRLGLPVEAGDDSVVTEPTEFVGLFDHRRYVDADYVLAHLDSEETLIVDAREPERYRGEKEPLDKKAGCIPGASNRHFVRNLSGGLFKSPDQLETEFKHLLDGVEPSRVVHSCGSGVTACHNLFAMEYCGLQGSRLYAGSWSDWILDSSRPIQTVAT
jgi:thiosulfate/3-mercaptopyruvate sulfurtransferase